MSCAVGTCQNKNANVTKEAASLWHKEIQYCVPSQGSEAEMCRFLMPFESTNTMSFSEVPYLQCLIHRRAYQNILQLAWSWSDRNRASAVLINATPRLFICEDLHANFNSLDNAIRSTALTSYLIHSTAESSWAFHSLKNRYVRNLAFQSKGARH